MKIFHLIPSLGGGGAERQLCLLATQLSKMGHEVHIAYAKNNSANMGSLNGVILHQINAKSNYDPTILWQLFILIRKIKPNILQTWIFQMDIFGGLIAKALRIPWILREPTTSKNYSGTFKNKLRVFFAAGTKSIVSNSEGGNEYWQVQLPHSTRFIVRNGLPVTDIEKAPAQLDDVELFRLSPYPIVLYVGRLTSDISGNKNLKVLLESIAIVTRERKCQLILCGDGPQREELEKLSIELGIKEMVFFIGHMPEKMVWKLMKNASAFVSLSEYEGCPNSVMEAMACECPLILSDIPAHHEILDNESALFTDRTNPHVVAASILNTLNFENISKGRAAKAKEKVYQWTVDIMAEQYEAIYQNILN